MLDISEPRTHSNFADLLQVRPHHLRSVQIERDFTDPRATLHYVITPFTAATTKRFAQSLSSNSTARAWRLTGDYGSGKSSLALVLARLAGGQTDFLPEELHKFTPDVRLEPVLVVGERESIGRGVLRGLRTTLARRFGAPKRGEPKVLADETRPEPTRVIAAVQCTMARLKTGGHADGLFIVLDELGKNLEHAVEQVGGDDVYLLQHLAEIAARSADTPIIVMAILHQAVASYAAVLPSAQRREWEKVAGRYEEVVFAPPLEQTAILVSAALDLDCNALPKRLAVASATTMGAAVEIGWYGVGAARGPLEALAPSLLPLDPTTLPVLARLLRRFGQNERSLFSFLSSNEPFGLMSHAQAPIEQITPFRLHHLYDYLSANLSGFLSSGPHATRWGIIEEVVRSATVGAVEETTVLKTVALLNLLDDPGLPATRDAVVLAVAGAHKISRIGANRALEQLTKKTRILYDRGSGGALCLWPHTSVDLDHAFAEACALVDQTPSIEILGRLLSAEPLVARRHYVETGALRYFALSYCTLANLGEVLTKPDPTMADGRIVVVLSATEAEHAEAISKMAERAPGLPHMILVGVARPLGGLGSLLRDVEAWTWVRDNTAALAGDRLARTEVSRQLSLAQDRLTRAIAALLDVRGPAAASIAWSHAGRPLILTSGRALLSHLSSVCDTIFRASPKVRNELINRRALSSAAARARFLLIEKLATAADQPALGLQTGGGTPPELAMYLSIFQAGKVHIEKEGRWRIAIPDETADPLRLRPVLLRIGEILRKANDRQVPFEELARELTIAPYGVRAGLTPLLIAVYLSANWHWTAVYENGTYLDQVGGPEFNRIVKEPEHFTFQHCAIEGVRAEVFVKLATVVGVTPSSDLDLLDVVRPLVLFVARLSDHARRTRHLSVSTVAVRTALLEASDPTALIFRILPQACGLQPIDPLEATPALVLDNYVRSMITAIRELREAYPNLLKRIAASLGAALGSAETLTALRPELTQRAVGVLPTLTEPEIKTFTLRLADRGLDDQPWLESLASLVARKPPERWADTDEAEYHHRLSILTRRFSHIEAAQFTGDRMAAREGGIAYRLLVTAADGREVEQVYRAKPQDHAALAGIETELRRFLTKKGHLGKLAATRLLMSLITDEQAQIPPSTRSKKTT